MISWFSSQSSSRQSLEPAGPARGRRSEHISPPDKVGESGIEQDGVQVDPQPATDHQFVPVLSTPHDAVLADISGHPLNAMPFSTSDVVRSDIASSVPLPKPSLGSMERVDGTTSPSGTLGKSIIVGDLTSAAGPSSATSPVPNTAPELEQMYDPFTGQPIGFLPPHSSPNSRIPVQINPSPRDASHERSETVQSQAQFEQSKEDLWSHVAKIRKLQSEIAGMHIDLEGIGQGGDAFGVSLGGGNGGGVGGMPKRPSGPGGRLHGDTIGGGEQWYDPEEEEKERKRAMDAEFQTLAETFDGRAGAINGIMEKLEELSKALTTFHALPTPRIDFANSRSGTKDSSAIASPVLRSPSPMFANPTAHGPLSPPSPPLVPTKVSSKSITVPRADIGGKVDIPLVDSPTSHHHPLTSFESPTTT